MKLKSLFAEIEIQTYNVALHNRELGANNRTTRRENIASDIKGSSADVMCLQEIFYEADLRYVRFNVCPMSPFATRFKTVGVFRNSS